MLMTTSTSPHPYRSRHASSFSGSTGASSGSISDVLPATEPSGGTSGTGQPANLAPVMRTVTASIAGTGQVTAPRDGVRPGASRLRLVPVDLIQSESSESADQGALTSANRLDSSEPVVRTLFNSAGQDGTTLTTTSATTVTMTTTTALSAQEKFFRLIDACDTRRLRDYLTRHAGEIQLNAPDAIGQTALTRLAGMTAPVREQRGISSHAIHAAIVLLINAGATPNRIDAQGDTPLLAAIKADNLGTFRCLLGNGAGPAIKGRGALTPLNLAARLGRSAIIEDYIFMMTTPDPEQQARRWRAGEPEESSDFFPAQYEQAFGVQQEEALQAFRGATPKATARCEERIRTAVSQTIERGSTEEWQLQHALKIAVSAGRHYTASVLQAHGIQLPDDEVVQQVVQQDVPRQ